jgi:hypothetical protein
MEKIIDSDEEITEKNVRNQDVLSEEEILNTLNMNSYKERINNILGKEYSYLFFDYFENIYHSNVRNKISAPLTKFLNKLNNIEDSLWMKIYKSIKFYSKENVPILVAKYLILKADIEFKFIFSESKKYTKHPFKFINVYIKKMKRMNYKKLKESKYNSLNEESQTLRLNHMRSFLYKKPMLRPRLKSSHKLLIFENDKEEKNSNSSKNEEDIKYKKQMRAKIMKQIHQMKINSIREVEIANKLQNKQKKKYGGIQSRFFDIYKNQDRILQILNSKSIHKIFNNNLYNSKNSMNTINNSKLSYFYSKENNYSKKSTPYYSKHFSDLFDSKSSNTLYYSRTQSNSKNINSHKNVMAFNRVDSNERIIYNKYQGKKSLFNLKDKFKINDYRRKNKIFSPSHKNNNDINTLVLSDMYNDKSNFMTNSIDTRKRVRSGINRKKNYIKSIINKLEKKRNKEFLENLNYDKDSYNNKIFELFKNTECL